MGKVIVPAKIENWYDLAEVDQGRRPVDQVRRIEVSNAVADTATLLLALPRSVIRQLGMEGFQPHTARTSQQQGLHPLPVLVRLTLQGRDCTCEVAELPDDHPVIIGRLPLELQLDFVVDPTGQRLIGNPAHGGEQMFELY